MWREGAPCAGGPGCRAPSRPPCVRRGTGVRGFASSRQPAAAGAGNAAAARASAQSVRDRAPFAPPHVVDVRLPARAVAVVADGCGRPRLEDGGVVPAAGRALSTQRPCSARGLRVARAYHSPRWLASTSVFGRGSIRPRRPSALILSKGERDREHQVTGARGRGSSLRQRRSQLVRAETLATVAEASVYVEGWPSLKRAAVSCRRRRRPHASCARGAQQQARDRG